MEDYEALDFGSSHSQDLETYDEFELHRISRVKRYRNKVFSRVGYCTRFTKPFTILLKGGFNHFLTEEEQLQREAEIREMEEAYYGRGGEDYDESEEEDDTGEARDGRREDFSINDSRTFKLEECVICLEEKPKVLFCNCSHLCICEKCLVRRFDNCPVCKKKNTILRIIE